MDDPKEHSLVVKALTSGLSNCILWRDDRTIARIISNPELMGLTPREIKSLLIMHVVEEGPGVVIQVCEKREEYRNRYRFYYKTILHVEGYEFRHGLFVEYVLADDDEDCPVVHLVNTHPQPEG